MLDQRKMSKIKNSKIQQGRFELGNFECSIRYRPGVNNCAADALSRLCNSLSPLAAKNLFQIHDTFGHPGITRLWHFIRSKNLPLSLDQGWPTSQMLRATFLSVVLQRAISYT